MSEEIIFIATIEIDDYDHGWIEESSVSKTFTSVKDLLEYVRKLGVDSAEELKSALNEE